ncbi:P-loop containing nucleoside triphosphate hydrolase protein [Glomus cerebriforme]|uniref:P-loop containing nucleoside triphosphate hydrolase protein n=1 Tax=Glomus cerebriforme TaxID=658196 RepID=A0A397TJM4_9GLOM|nr:P-loop containing nucleoside triphosphate hydrolase protein [Glomus cerebriforme]
MSLWVDEYRPKSLEELTYHSDLTKRLKILASSEDFPHLLVYGPSGAGKKTRISCLLRELFGEGVQKLKTDIQTFTNSSSRKIDITVVSSKYHLEITPNEVGFSDRLVVQEFLKDVAQTKQVDLSIKHDFKVVIIHEADLLTRESQAALRRTMELYMSNVRLILCCKSPSKIIDPIRSRCLLIRVPAPTIDEIITILINIAKKTNVNLPLKVAKLIADQSNRDLRKAILSFESLYMEYDVLKDNIRYRFTDWEEIINDIANKISLHYNPENLENIRDLLYELLNTYILPSNLIKYLFLAIVRRADESVKFEILEKAAEFEHRIVTGSKALIHIEAFVINAMYIIGRYKNGLGTISMDID